MEVFLRQIMLASVYVCVCINREEVQAIKSIYKDIEI